MLVCGDARRIPLADESVQMVCTSPPYWGLRRYAGEQELVWGGDAACEHKWNLSKVPVIDPVAGAGAHWQHQEAHDITAFRKADRRWDAVAFCRKCGAWRGAYGLEPSVEMYVQDTVELLREIRRVIRSDGVCFFNLGDSYFSNPGNGRGGGDKLEGGKPHYSGSPRAKQNSLKPKDLCLIPQRVALAAQADGWWVRSDIIWSKLNPMPESCRDRPTDAYEHVLMLTKSVRYFWDADAVREPMKLESYERGKYGYRESERDRLGHSHHGKGYQRNDGTPVELNPNGRNLRNVWTFPTQPYSGAHFATFPEELPRRCILAATSAKGACRFCGAPWERVVQSTVCFEGGSGKAISRDPQSWKGSKFDTGKTAEHHGNRMQIRSPHDGETDSGYAEGTNANRIALLRQAARERGGEYANESQTIGWRPTCECRGQHGRTVPCVVLDPFAGSGTTGQVAIELGRRAVLLDLAYTRGTAEDKEKHREYDRLAERRTRNVQMPLLVEK